MKLNSEKIFNEYFQEYSEMLRAGDSYSAVSILARMLRSLQTLPTDKMSEWKERILGEAISQESLEAAVAGVRRDVSRLNKILSTGSKYNDDECVLILTLRNQIEAVQLFLQERYSYHMDIVLTDIDEAIRLIAKSEENRHSFAKAINQIIENGRLSFDGKLLSLQDKK
jgi:hypothetical protein